MLGAGVVLRTPDGGRHPLVGMTEVVPGTDRYAAQVTAGCEGRWRFQVEAWGDPIAHWRHDAAIKVPRGLDVGLMMTEGAILFERAARSIRPDRPNGGNGPGRAAAGTAVSPARPALAGAADPPGARGTPGAPGPQGARWAEAARAAQVTRAARSALMALAARLRDPAIPPWDRLAAADDEEIMAILAAYPLRELVTRSASYPLVVHRQRALYGAWYEFFPRSEGVRIDPMGRREPAGGPCAPRPAGWSRSPPWVSTWSTCRRSTRSGRPPARGATTRCGRLPAIPGRRGRSAHRPAATTPSTPSSGRSTTSTTSSAGPASSGLRSRSTWPCRRRRITPGSPSTRNGSPPGPTARSPTRRTRPRDTRTSTRSTSTTTPRASTPRCCGSCGTGWITGSGSSGWTTPTPSRCRSGNGCWPRWTAPTRM